MHVWPQKLIGWVITGLSVVFSLAKFYIWFVGLSTTIEDTEALPEKAALC